jgi:hypothetical protein
VAVAAEAAASSAAKQQVQEPIVNSWNL